MVRELSSYSNWSIYGLNLMLNWSLQQIQSLLTKRPLNESVVDLNPIEWALIRQMLEGSRDLQARLEALHRRQVSINFPVQRSVGNDVIAALTGNDDATVSGNPNLGIIFNERNR